MNGIDPEDEARAAAAAFGAGSAPGERARSPDSAEEDTFEDAQEELDSAAKAAAAAAAAAAAGTGGEGTKHAGQGIELLIVFVHGFRGSAERTFGPFPARIESVLRATYRHVRRVESVVYPTYDTRGQLAEAVEAFSEWLMRLVLQRESHPGGGGRGSVRVILCGHSMGGLVIADAARSLLDDAAASRRAGEPMPDLWPRVHAVLAFDTPYLGVHPHVFRNAIGSTISTANQYVSTARDVSSALGGAFGWGTSPSAGSTSTRSAASPTTGGGFLWAAAGAAAVAVAGVGLAAGAWSARPQSFEESYSWVVGHLAFVGTLWDSAGHAERMRQLDALVRTHNVFFRCWYTLLPPPPQSQEQARTFIILPPARTALDSAFVPAITTRAQDEISAHRGMFSPGENDGYYALGADVARTASAAFAADLRGRDQSRTARAAPPRSTMHTPTPSHSATATASSRPTATTAQPTPTTSAKPTPTPTPTTSARPTPAPTPTTSVKPTPTAVPPRPTATATPLRTDMSPTEAQLPGSGTAPPIPSGSRFGSAELTSEQEEQKQEFALAAARAAAERREEQPAEPMDVGREGLVR